MDGASDVAQPQDAAADVTATTPTTLATGISYPWCIAGDATNVYYCSSSQIWAVSKNGGTPTMLVSNGTNNNYLAIAPSPSALFILDYVGATARVPLDGGAAAWKSPPPGGSPGFGLVLASSSLYWAMQSSNAIDTISVDGGGETAIVTNQTSPVEIAGDDGAIFWANQSSTQGSIVAESLPSGSPTPLTPAMNAQHISSDSNNVYYVAAGSGGWPAVLSIPRAGGAAKELFGHDGGLPLGYGPIAIATDGNAVYTALSDGKIYKAALDGSGATVVVTKTSAQPTTLLVDATSLYWIEGSQIDGGSLRKVPKP